MLPKLALATAAVALTLPAAAHAEGMVTAGPIKVKDYKMTVTGIDGKQDAMSVMFIRTSGKAMQMHTYSFSKGVDVKVAGNMGSASIKGSLGRFGAVNLKLGKAGGVKRFAPPAGCTGTASKGRSGALKGSFKLVADTTYFKTVSASSLKALAFKGGKLDCGGSGDGDGGGSQGGGTTLSSTVQGPEGMLIVSASKKGGSTTQTVMRMDDAAATAPASIMHHISAPGGAFDVAPGLESASLKGASAFLSGAASFTSDTVSGTTSMGKLGGDYTAKFDSIGSIAVGAAAPDAILMAG